ncbi:hypothetical protein C1H46_026278 [Malus baccata]|uniref:Uncharacterized protein n=1 Tax=Malus baccata TaxID=106549 RepID=A0A540LNZ8_MALBA|nr:hypothetical protein C1H46_026278 [Malus baccata]
MTAEPQSEVHRLWGLQKLSCCCSIHKMYPLSSSSSPQKPMGLRPSTIGLTRYDSAISSLPNSVVDSVIGTAADFDFSSLRSQPLIGYYFFGNGHGDSFSFTSFESTFKVNSSNCGYREANTTKPLL